MNGKLLIKSGRLSTAVLVGAVVGLIGAPPAFSDNGNKTAGLEKSVVYLETAWTGFVQVPPSADKAGEGYWTDERKYSVTCTGFYVSKTGDIVTAGHCVDPGQGRQVIIDAYLDEQNALDLKQEAYSNWVVEGDQKGSSVGRTVRAIQPNGVDGATITSPTTVQVVDFQATDAGDIALLHLPNTNKETPGLVVAEKAPQVGEDVTSIGFPGDIQDIADQSQIARASFKTGTVSSDQVTPTGVTQIEVSTELAPGMSGGPTVNKDEQVVGVNSSGLTKQAGFNFITYTPDLRSFLQSHNVPLVQPAAPPRGTSPVLWIVIGAVVVLAVAAGLLLLLLRRGRTPKFAGAGPATGGYAMPGGAGGMYSPQAQMPGPSPSGPITQPAATVAPPPTSEQLGSPAMSGAPAAPVGSGSTYLTGGGDATAGQTMAAGKYCPSCGAGHEPDDHFCPQCGKPME